MTAQADLHTLTGAYALDALEEDERVAFEQHLAKCEDCAQEVCELTATAGRLALAATMPPPPRLKAQVLEQIAGVRQQERPHSGVTALSRTARRGHAMRWALAACVAAAAALGGTTLWQHQQADEARQQAQVAQRQADQITEVLSAPDAKVTSSLMNPSRTNQSVLMAGAVGKASGVGVTLEPDGGSKQPTTQPVALLQLPA
ncbi:RskA family anti-sigma factor [Streptomyces longispororuber]|uniref:anti-sigma factor n=1 Tax=Streptomyces longispororuber TaxID=68230 RepID=UPI00210D3628|nr:anti-sigma factor [Streptomyces longispororuber]MCQ4205627.1 anti-sigma factor [Streptomyces longispororuber]